MITPEDNLAPDDSTNPEADDQQSQKDIHSIGLDERFEETENEEADTDLLNQAFRASESSFTLGLDNPPPTSGAKDDKKSD